jgi:hypothetical protein
MAKRRKDRSRHPGIPFLGRTGFWYRVQHIGNDRFMVHPLAWNHCRGHYAVIETDRKLGEDLRLTDTFWGHGPHLYPAPSRFEAATFREALEESAKVIERFA